MRLCNPKQKALGAIVYRLICFGAGFRSQIAPKLRIGNRLVGHVMPRDFFNLRPAARKPGFISANFQQASCYFAPKHCRRVPTSVRGLVFRRGIRTPFSGESFVGLADGALIATKRVSLVPSVGVFDIRKVVSKRSIKISDSMVMLPGSALVASPP
jgi:hypothetical protein